MTTGNETNADRHGGHQFIYGSSVTSLVTGGTVFFFRTARRNYYPAAWEFATAREPKHLNLPFRKFLRISKPRSWTGDPKHVKYRSISLGPLAHAGFVIVCACVFVKTGYTIIGIYVYPSLYKTPTLSSPGRFVPTSSDIFCSLSNCLEFLCCQYWFPAKFPGILWAFRGLTLCATPNIKLKVCTSFSERYFQIYLHVYK